MTSDVCNCPSMCHHNDTELTAMTKQKLSHVTTDRSQKNSKWTLERVMYSIENLKDFGIEITIKNKYPQYEIYQSLSLKNGKNLAASEPVFTMGCSSLEGVWTALGSIYNLLETKYIFEKSTKEIAHNQEKRIIKKMELAK